MATAPSYGTPSQPNTTPGYLNYWGDGAQYNSNSNLPQYSGGQQGQDFGFGATQTPIQPGQANPLTTGTVKSPITQAPGPSASQEVRNNFLSPNLTAPFYNMAGVAGNVGTALSSTMPGATNFLQGLFSPNLNSLEQNFLGAELAHTQVALEQGQNRLMDQYENTPMHGALMQQQRELQEGVARQFAQTGAQMGLQRQGLAAQLAQMPFQGSIEASKVPVEAATGLFNMGNAAFNADYNIPMQAYTQVPVSAPALVQGGGGGGGGGKSLI